MEPEQAWIGEGARAELEPLRAVLSAAGIEAWIAPPPPGCGGRT